MRPKDDLDRRVEEFLKEHPLNDPPKPKPIRLAVANPKVPLRAQEARIKEKVDHYKADHDRELKALREQEEKRAEEWRKQRARERLTAELQYKLDLAKYVQDALEPAVKHEYNPYSRRWMYGAD